MVQWYIFKIGARGNPNQHKRKCSASHVFSGTVNEHKGFFCSLHKYIWKKDEKHTHSIRCILIARWCPIHITVLTHPHEYCCCPVMDPLILPCPMQHVGPVVLPLPMDRGPVISDCGMRETTLQAPSSVVNSHKGLSVGYSHYWKQCPMYTKQTY